MMMSKSVMLQEYPDARYETHLLHPLGNIERSLRNSKDATAPFPTSNHANSEIPAKPSRKVLQFSPKLDRSADMGLDNSLASTILSLPTTDKKISAAFF